MAANPSSEDRVGAVVRYAPWWLNCNGNLTSHRLTPRMVPFAYLTSNSADWRLSESTSRCGCTTQMCGCDRLIELLLLWHARQTRCANTQLERHIICHVQVPREIFAQLHPGAQPLFRHVAEGEEDGMALEKQLWTVRLALPARSFVRAINLLRRYPILATCTVDHLWIPLIHP